MLVFAQACNLGLEGIVSKRKDCGGLCLSTPIRKYSDVFFGMD
jgi:hypothetical protein